jgi:hypothetical protein
MTKAGGKEGGKSLFARLKSAFLEGAEADGNAPGATPDPPPGQSASDDRAWVPLTLEDLLKESPSARVHIVSLADYRKAIGAAWSAKRDKILILAETVLRGHLRPGDICLHRADALFALILRGPDPQETTRRARQAAEDLGHRLVGEKYVGAATADLPWVRLASLPADQLRAGTGELDDAKLANAALTAAPIPPKAPTAAAPPAQPAAKPEAKPGESGPGWQKAQHDAWRKSIDLVPIAPGGSARQAKRKSEPDWTPIKKDK